MFKILRDFFYFLFRFLPALTLQINFIQVHFHLWQNFDFVVMCSEMP